MNKIPTPPNYETSIKAAFQDSTLSYSRHPLNEATAEFTILMDLMDAHHIQNGLTVSRIANPVLYSQFCARRAELIKLKCRDSSILQSVGLTEEEISLWTSSQTLKELPEYSDNCALLFHCTKTDLNAVLSEGLDNRKAAQGSLGPGIYFSASPGYSLRYDRFSTIIVFMVLLGDCLNVTQHQSPREPEKAPSQRRNKFDMFFDSICSNDQYVIFNASQCVPLYTVAYNSASTSFPHKSRAPPAFTWSSNGPPQIPSKSWKFDARQVFAKMSSTIVAAGPQKLNLPAVAVCQICTNCPCEWIQLTCSHWFNLCSQCRNELEDGNIFGQCPWCSLIVHKCYGKGSMTTSVIYHRTPGYDSRTIAVDYKLPGSTKRAYFPQTTEGSRIVELLKRAWDRRLTFKLDQSNKPVFIFEHKTSLSGGIEKNGYPDTGYLERLVKELEKYGIQ
ncbi:E3 ubiquitin-protein ligase dtx3l [Entophlyctis luteolus]|nr:E3 ubiquitin-protein ligase dtx3l [Entophlyctis luteolus]KAJ3391634.1 E3 ubiquitin-protein ligase dtx3l [Entophlyctis sp. JEL0112]